MGCKCNICDVETEYSERFVDINGEYKSSFLRYCPKCFRIYTREGQEMDSDLSKMEVEEMQRQILLTSIEKKSNIEPTTEN